jgi:hypothetical protein
MGEVALRDTGAPRGNAPFHPVSHFVNQPVGFVDTAEFGVRPRFARHLTPVYRASNLETMDAGFCRQSSMATTTTSRVRS